MAIFCIYQKYSVTTRVGIKKPTQNNPSKKKQKNPHKKPLKMGFLGFLKFFIFYENNTNFSLSNRFFMNK
jgi:hypothetical protein